jgi:hypothetical protein
LTSETPRHAFDVSHLAVLPNGNHNLFGYRECLNDHVDRRRYLDDHDTVSTLAGRIICTGIKAAATAAAAETVCTGNTGRRTTSAAATSSAA